MRPYVARHKALFFLINIFIAVAAYVETLIPLRISYVIDEVLDTGVLNGKELIVTNFLIILGLGIADLFANMIMRLVANRISQGIIYDIRQDIYIALQNQEVEYYSKESVGQIMARTIEEIFSLRDLMTWSYRISILTIFLFAGAIISMFSISWQLAMVFLVIPVLMVLITAKVSYNNRQKFYNSRFTYGEMNQALAENLSGIHVVKSFGREPEEVQKFNIFNQKYFDVSMQVAGVRSTIIPGMIFMISSALILLMGIGGYFIAIGGITAGQFVAFMMLSLNLAIPGRFIGFVGIVVQDSNAAAIRLNEIFNAPQLLHEGENARDIEQIDGRIRFENVSFDYPEGVHAIHNINLKIDRGEKIALLGKNGAGKSSLINLIPRLFDPGEGRICIDDMDIKTDFTLTSLRNNIGIVHQEAFLFTLSLHDNIAYARPDATREEVIEAAKLAQIHDFIDTLPDGYETLVGERGVTLSGGQRQRVAIARVLLKDPQILIFDDSVSAIDPATEAKIQQSLEAVAKNRTTIIISQRPSSLKFVDRVVVMDDAHIMQDGKHDDLLKVKGPYRDFINAVNTQIKFMDWDQSHSKEEEVEVEVDRS